MVDDDEARRGRRTPRRRPRHASSARAERDVRGADRPAPAPDEPPRAHRHRAVAVVGDDDLAPRPHRERAEDHARPAAGVRHEREVVRGHPEVGGHPRPGRRDAFRHTDEEPDRRALHLRAVGRLPFQGERRDRAEGTVVEVAQGRVEGEREGHPGSEPVHRRTTRTAPPRNAAAARPDGNPCPEPLEDPPVVQGVDRQPEEGTVAWIHGDVDALALRGDGGRAPGRVDEELLTLDRRPSAGGLHPVGGHAAVRTGQALLDDHAGEPGPVLPQPVHFVHLARDPGEAPPAPHRQQDPAEGQDPGRGHARVDVPGAGADVSRVVMA